MRITTLRKWTLPLLLILILLPSGAAPPQARSAEIPPIPGTADDELPAGTIIYLPLVVMPLHGAEITEAWIGNQDGIALSTFLPGAPIEYILTGINHRTVETPVDLSWHQAGPCGSGQIITKTLELDPGLWVDIEPSTAPDCIGVYTATALISGTNFTSTQTINYRVNTASVVISEQQGFDRCNHPSIAEMQTWWDSSPYYVANVYLGGISYDNTSGCSNDNVDTNWMQSVADQGWSFLLAWVGPQAPCSGYTYKMSYFADESYQEGRTEAELALQAAADIGLASSIIIYYDVEGYGNEYNYTCRNAVDSFLQGWTDRLDELGAKSGAYGSPCNSHVSDWADNNPPPNDVWVAHWIKQYYDPFATVWDVTCLSNDLWPDHQRVRQYAGDHTETWGGLPLRIDSNVLDGEVVALSITGTVTTTLVSSFDTPQIQLGPETRDLDLLSPDHGWVLADDRLLLTADGGTRWDDLTPKGTGSILDVHFLDAASGWLIRQSGGALDLLSTSDGGASWVPVALPFSSGEFAAASLDFTDLNSGRLILKLPTGSSFNIIREFISQDGGQTWLGGETRLMPVVESLPAQVNADGDLPDGTILLDWVDGDTAWALAQQGRCQGIKTPPGTPIDPDASPWQCRSQTQLWMTVDAGQTWREITLPAK